MTSSRPSVVLAAGAEPLIDATVGEVLHRVASEHPNQPGVAWLTAGGVGVASWREIADRADAAAAEIQCLSPGGSRVMLVGTNSVDWVVALFGCAIAGRSVLPVSPFATLSELAAAARRSGVQLVLTQEFAGEHRIGEIVRQAVGRVSNGPGVRSMSGWPEVGVAVPRASVGTSTAEFMLQLTSGTTGEPKAASLSHFTALNCAAFFARAVGCRRGEAWFNPLPLHHVGGLVSGLLSTMTVGGTYVVIERFNPEIAMRVFREIRPALAGLVPTMLVDLLAQPDVHEADFASIRAVIGGATDVDPHLISDVERRLGMHFLVGYGQSESPNMAVTLPADAAEVRTASLGHPLPGRDYCIRNKVGDVVPIGEVGELWVRGPLNMSGYVRADGSLDPAIDDQGWRATGDLCALDDDGVLWFRGRLRDVIIRGGTNVYPAEVEHVMSEHSGVAAIAVFGVPDERLGQRVVAAVITADDYVLDSADVSAFARERLGSQKRPTEWIAVDAFPRTSAGKVRKHLLTQMYGDGTLRAAADRDART